MLTGVVVMVQSMIRRILLRISRALPTLGAGPHPLLVPALSLPSPRVNPLAVTSAGDLLPTSAMHAPGAGGARWLAGARAQGYYIGSYRE